MLFISITNMYLHNAAARGLHFSRRSRTRASMCNAIPYGSEDAYTGD